MKAAVDKKVNGKGKRRKLYEEEGVSKKDAQFDAKLQEYPRKFFVFDDSVSAATPVFETEQLFKEIAAEKQLLETQQIAAESIVLQPPQIAPEDVLSQPAMGEAVTANAAGTIKIFDTTPPEDEDLEGITIDEAHFTLAIRFPFFIVIFQRKPAVTLLWLLVLMWLR